MLLWTAGSLKEVFKAAHAQMPICVNAVLCLVQMGDGGDMSFWEWRQRSTGREPLRMGRPEEQLAGNGREAGPSAGAAPARSRGVSYCLLSARAESSTSLRLASSCLSRKLWGGSRKVQHHW